MASRVADHVAGGPKKTGRLHDALAEDAGLIGEMVAGDPLMTLKVVAAIHLEALKLWMKRVPLVRRLPLAGRAQKRARRTRTNEVAKRGMHQRRKKRIAW